MRTVLARFLRAADQVGLPGQPTEVFVTDDEFYHYWTFVPVEPDPNRFLQAGSQSFIPEMLVGRTDILAVIDQVLAADVSRAWASAWAIRCRSADAEDLMIDDLLDTLALLQLHYADAEEDGNLTPLDYVCSVQELDKSVEVCSTASLSSDQRSRARTTTSSTNTCCPLGPVTDRDASAAVTTSQRRGSSRVVISADVTDALAGGCCV
jgi:hypothetical protein